MLCLVNVSGRPALFRGETEEGWIWGRWEVQEKTSGREGRENCNWDAIYDRIMKRNIKRCEIM